mmetsp:Transcript_84526/g.217735  ORF Transcript_84526/g.217735 Transcript_84526/m.217735 type:complete len:268 (-) Transcript_84526:150-953(-)|eukprot:CAMPEP_0195102508 /NCGR_PEP_ID=MMETSP0448-20130528/68091_1 /TAXON_ID=66468 /ORGANISM="Heterocapsa triquestra, Strain CCMP 448" /LENGTH=267 /DNA_ID=CAMNT_0040138017 /DNA_START=64 /DNA_END=867 /DNA_ORIENTATION=-
MQSGMASTGMAAALIAALVSCAGACDCRWTNNGANCGASDGSECWSMCCGGYDIPKGCSNGEWTQAYSPAKCRLEGNTAIVECTSRSGEQCGTRLASNRWVGEGSHTLRVKAAPGSGVASTFYMSTNGGLYDKTKTKPWVELDFEIFGHTAGGHSKIWTNMLTGIAVENWQWITVPFDVTAEYHTYGFRIEGSRIKWIVDGETYRTEDVSSLWDVKHAISNSRFQEFISVWGKNSTEEGEGIPEFRAGLGLMDNNHNHFPVYAGYVL